MNKLLCIVGPTGTGKTAKALEVAKECPSILVSADSRQVYRGMDVVTGKDHPKNTIIYGIDIVKPNQSCSVSIWYDAVMPEITRAWKENKQVIVVGGTGLYVKALVEGIPTMQVPINQSLRDSLESLSITELQAKLYTQDPAKLASMNHSDSLNSRRLIRAIEVAISPQHPPTSNVYKLESKLIGLKYSDESIQRNKILERVISRLDQGAIDETEALLSKYDKNTQSMTAIGYKHIIGYLENQLTKDAMVETWVADELKYAKRQLTWFRKVKSIEWYDIGI